MNNFSLKLAIRYFGAEKNNKLVSFISAFSLLGVTIGVAALIVVMAVMRGFHVELVSNIIGINGDAAVYRYKSDSITNYEEIESKIKNVEGVEAVIPQISTKALAVTAKDSMGVIVKGIRPSDLKHKKILQDGQLRGAIENINDGFSVAIGKELALSLGVTKIGDEITLIVPSTISSIFGELPRKKTFKLVSIFSSKMYDYDAATIIMSLDSAQKVFSMKDGLNYFEVFTKDKEHNEKTLELINESLSSEFYVQSWIESNTQFLNALKTERVAMFTILTLIIIVAAFNIISSLFMLVSEKSKDIAILKTMGASKTQIMMIFIFNGFFIGMLGTGLGVFLGILFANNIEKIRKFLESISGTNLFDAAIYFLYTLPSVVEFESVIFISAMSLILCLLATIYPAYKAASMDPVEAFRNE